MGLFVQVYYKCCGFYINYYNYICSFWGNTLFCWYNISIRNRDVISSMVFWTIIWLISCVVIYWWNKRIL